MALKFITRNVFDEMLAHAPEWAMGCHLVAGPKDDAPPSIVLGGQVLVEWGEGLPDSLKTLARLPWLGEPLPVGAAARQSLSEQRAEFDAWCNHLVKADYQEVQPLDREGVNRFILDPIDPAKTPRGPNPIFGPNARPAVHGHLPFAGTTSETTRFFRAEPFPTSRYIDKSTDFVRCAGGLYGFPPSELPFVPTGFSAVGRYALPNVAPAIYRYELRAPAGTKFSAGASVPLYGQAGGGVELCIEQDFQNVGHIADATILPSL